MLKPEDNKLLTRVGPGTTMGELLRRFWLPALMEEEVHENDGAPVRLRLLGEDLMAFRDTEGRLGVLDAYCPHRRAHLYFGRNEECGIRCVYHGWKFDVTGQCLDMPSEPSETNFKDRVKTKSYSTAARGGIVWVYMGPDQFKPELPDFEWARLSKSRCEITKRSQQCNWAQAVEGGIDSSHISYLHRNLADLVPSKSGTGHRSYTSRDRSPKFTIKETDYGLLIGASRNATKESFYWRITQFLSPFWTMIPPILGEEVNDSSQDTYAGHAFVPIDDENTWTWSFNCNPHRDFNEKEQALFHPRTGLWGPIDDSYRPVWNKENDYGLDREMQKNVNYTGIKGIPNQDVAVQESMGPIADRSREMLGTSDKAIIAYRQLLIDMAKDLQNGQEPKASSHGGYYNVRSASVLLKKDVPFDKGAAWLLSAKGPRKG
ncbi:MAG TPA: aromatic ring-hydroxylating dioxygenase subunit alpha [Acidobacteria bacterium]|nr:aromatic ring-hydroxylating dioxygenase subunit alpha [Acidobacteriota bacterium]